MYAAHNYVLHGFPTASGPLYGDFLRHFHDLTAGSRIHRSLNFSAAHNIMETRTDTSFRPEEAYAAAAERFFELMKTFGMTAGTTGDWKALATPLATQFERWLQMSQAWAPWFTAGASGSPGLAFGAPAAAAFGPLPLGPAAVQGAEIQLKTCGKRTGEGLLESVQNIIVRCIQ